MSISRIWWIFQKEVSALFGSLVAYVVVVLFLVIVGGMFWVPFFEEVSPVTMRSFFMQAPLFLCFFVPALTMHMFASEEQSGTLELMMTLPIARVELVLGKFLAAYVLLLAALGMTLTYPLTLHILASQQGVWLDFGECLAGYLGLMLLGGAYTAIGVMGSSLTRDQVVSVLVSFALCFALFMCDQLGEVLGLGGDALLGVQYLSTSYHFKAISRGLLSMADVVYFLSVMVCALAVTTARQGPRRIG